MKYNISNKKLQNIYKRVNSKLPKAYKYRNFEDFKMMYMTHIAQGTQDIERAMVYEARYNTALNTAIEEQNWVLELVTNGYDVTGVSLEELKEMTTQEFAERYGDALKDYRTRKYDEEYAKAIEEGLDEEDAKKRSRRATRLYISQYIFGSP